MFGVSGTELYRRMVSGESLDLEISQFCSSFFPENDVKYFGGKETEFFEYDDVLSLRRTQDAVVVKDPLSNLVVGTILERFSDILFCAPTFSSIVVCKNKTVSVKEVDSTSLKDILLNIRDVHGSSSRARSLVKNLLFQTMFCLVFLNSVGVFFEDVNLDNVYFRDTIDQTFQGTKFKDWKTLKFSMFGNVWEVENFNLVCKLGMFGGRACLKSEELNIVPESDFEEQNNIVTCLESFESFRDQYPLFDELSSSLNNKRNVLESEIFQEFRT